MYVLTYLHPSPSAFPSLRTLQLLPKPGIMQGTKEPGLPINQPDDCLSLGRLCPSLYSIGGAAKAGELGDGMDPSSSWRITTTPAVKIFLEISRLLPSIHPSRLAHWGPMPRKFGLEPACFTPPLDPGHQDQVPYSPPIHTDFLPSGRAGKWFLAAIKQPTTSSGLLVARLASRKYALRDLEPDLMNGMAEV